MKRRVAFGIGVAALASMLVACMGPPLDLPVEEGVRFDESEGQVITGRGCGMLLFGAIPTRVNERHQVAYERLMAEAGDKHVTEIRVLERWHFGVIGTRLCTVLTAKAYPIQSGEAPSKPSPMSPF